MTIACTILVSPSADVHHVRQIQRSPYQVPLPVDTTSRQLPDVGPCRVCVADSLTW